MGDLKIKISQKEIRKPKKAIRMFRRSRTVDKKKESNKRKCRGAHAPFLMLISSRI